MTTTLLFVAVLLLKIPPLYNKKDNDEIVNQTSPIAHNMTKKCYSCDNPCDTVEPKECKNQSSRCYIMSLENQLQKGCTEDASSVFKEDDHVCNEYNTGIVALPDPEFDASTYCYVCEESLCNENANFTKLPSPPSHVLKCYKCKSKDFAMCNNESVQCKMGVLECFAVVSKAGTYKQNCRSKGSIADDTCIQLQKGKNSSCKICEADLCNKIKKIEDKIVVPDEPTRTLPTKATTQPTTSVSETRDGKTEAITQDKTEAITQDSSEPTEITETIATSSTITSTTTTSATTTATTTAAATTTTANIRRSQKSSLQCYKCNNKECDDREQWVKEECDSPNSICVSMQGYIKDRHYKKCENKTEELNIKCSEVKSNDGYCKICKEDLCNSTMRLNGLVWTKLLLIFLVVLLF